MSDPPRLRWKGSALVLTLASVVLLTVAMAVPRYAGASAQIFVIVVGALVIRLLVQAIRVATSAPRPIVRWSSTIRSAGGSAGSPRIGSQPNTASIWMPTGTPRARSSARERGTCSGPITSLRRIGSDRACRSRTSRRS